MTDHRTHIITWALAGLFTVLSLVAHLTSPSSMHQPEDNWQLRVEYHRSTPAFAVRPITSAIVVFVHNTLGLSYRTSFFGLQFLLMLLCGPVLVRYLEYLGFSLKMSLAGMTIFYLSLPVFMAHFDPVYTWSDFWVYLMVPLSFTCLFRGQYLLAIVTMTWALLARETSLIFLPVWWYVIHRSAKGNPARSWLPTLAVLALWVAARLAFSGTAAGDMDYRLAFNFDGFSRGRDTVFSLLVSLGMMWPIGLYQIFRRPVTAVADYDLIRYGALFSAFGFVLSTLLLAQARETRLFFPPFIFFIPLTLIYIRDHGPAFALLVKKYRFLRSAGVVSIIIVMSLMIASILFPDFDFRTWKDGNRILFGLNLAMAIILFIPAFARLRYPNRP